MTTPELVALIVAAGAACAAFGALLMLLLIRSRLGYLVSTARRIGSGELGIEVRRMHGPLSALSKALAEIAATLDTAHTDATTDPLTGVANRPMLLSQLYSHVEHAGRYDRPLAILFADIDHFKDVNDTFGHEAGDAALRRVARLLVDNVRSADVVGRYGGEELIVVLPETGPDEAAALAEKIRKLVESERFRMGRNEFPLTISIGVAGGSGRAVRAEALIRDADAAMYTAKAMGRNQTVVFRQSEGTVIPRAPIGGLERATAYQAGQLGRNAAEDALLSLIFPREHFAGRPSPLIAAVAVALGHAVGLADPEIERIRTAALLHDIGKLAVPDEILHKPGPLTPDEWQLVVQHPRIGELIVEEAGKVRDTGSIILHHHERFGGRGYPHGLRGIEIPIGARILAIADAYDAMVLDRPYKPAVDHLAAVDELRQWAGSQFDPELVTLFCDLYALRPPRPELAVHARPRRSRAAS